MSAHAQLEPGMVHHQFEDLEQQRETYIVGMWTFLVTEVMMFGALFFVFMVYKLRHRAAFYEAHLQLDYRIGGINTIVLLVSSCLMAMAVYYHQNRKPQMTNLLLCGVQACGALFLVIKIALEWIPKIQHHLAPWNDFYYNGAAPSEVAHLFFNMYFGMTGLHGLHVLIGMIVIGGLQMMIMKKNPLTRDYVLTEMVGLYWHFVDIVWVFLYPLYYLMSK